MPFLPTPHLHVDLHGRGAAADARHAARGFLAPSVPGGPALPPLVLDDAHVTDTSSAEPHPARPDRRGEGGWGWNLVNRLGTDVEIRHHGSGGGKTIHVHVPR